MVDIPVDNQNPVQAACPGGAGGEGHVVIEAKSHTHVHLRVVTWWPHLVGGGGWWVGGGCQVPATNPALRAGTTTLNLSLTS